MAISKKIAIISPFSLVNYGLRQLMIEYFDQINCHIFSSVEQMMDSLPDSYDLYFVISEPVLINYDFFLPRKAKTIVMTLGSENYNSTSFFTLPLYSGLSQTIDSLQSMLEKLSSHSAEDNQEELSSREIDVLKLIAKGKMNKEIAEILFISLNTVLTHRKNITAKLGIKTVSGLTFYAMMNGYIKG
ncbi:MAG: helix-turn-helix transcriptional regulator [Bacteroidales bacterium]|nr:helix-turn-helix transcriptional regulator [Bacteroidales bacterium]